MIKTSLCSSLIVFIFIMVSSVSGYVWEGFENENLWSVMIIDGNAANSVELTDSQKSEGARALEIDLDKTSSDIKGFISREGKFDLSKVKELMLDIASEKPVKISLALVTGNDDWYETDVFELKRGMNKDLKIDLTAKTWKSAATEWKPTTQLENLQDTKKIILVITDSDAGKIIVDNIRFTGEKVINTAYQIPYSPLSKGNIVDETSILEDLADVEWAEKNSPGFKKDKKQYVLKYKDVNNSEKAAYKVQMDMTWNEYSKLVIEAKNNSNDYCSLALGIQVGDGWVWYESPQSLLKPKKTVNIPILLDYAYFKSEASGWKYNVKLPEKDNIKCITMMVFGLYGKKSNGDVIIKSMKLVKSSDK